MYEPGRKKPLIVLIEQYMINVELQPVDQLRGPETGKRHHTICDDNANGCYADIFQKQAEFYSWKIYNKI